MKKQRFILFSVALLFLLGSIALAGGTKEAPELEAVEKEVEEEELASEVKVYMSATRENNELISRLIYEGLGVKVIQHFMSCGEVGARLRSEAPRFSADMAINLCAAEAFEAKREGWAIPYISKEWAGAGKAFEDPDGVLTKLANYSTILIGNKDMLDEAGYTLPESWDDLLDPKWRGQIVVPSAVTSGNGYIILYSAMTLYGFNKGLTGKEAEDAGFKYLEALDKNIHHYARSSSTPADLVGRREFMLGMTQDAAALARIRKGYPLVWRAFDEGIGYGGTFALILKGAKEEYTCKKIIDFLGTKEVCEAYADLGNYVTKDPTVIPALYRDVGQLPKYITNLNEEWAVENKARLVTEWKERFLMKQEKKE